jgi:hypothetical protein
MKTRYLIASLVATTLLATSAFAVVRSGSSADVKPAAASFETTPVVHSALGLSRPI